MDGTMHTRYPSKLKKFKQSLSMKTIAMVFWNKKDVLHFDFIEQGTTII